MTVSLRVGYGISSQGKLLGFWNDEGIHLDEDYFDMNIKNEGCIGNQAYYLKRGDEDEEENY